MQQELDSENPELSIRILGVNELGHDADNALMTADRDLPWLQDIDDDGNSSSDTWDSWDVTFRDVIITDSTNVQVAVYNLTNNDLSNADNYSTLKQLLIDSASDTSKGVRFSSAEVPARKTKRAKGCTSKKGTVCAATTPDSDMDPATSTTPSRHNTTGTS